MSITKERIKDRKAVIAVLGLGYVGLPLSLVFAEAGFPVVGFDIDEKKVEALKRGKSYLKHIPSDRVAQAVKDLRMTATSDFTRISECDAAIICVPTPLNRYLQPDLSFVENTCRAIAPHIKPHTLVSLESTTWPGTTIEVVKPILESDGHLALGKDLYLCFSPEREDPGNPDFSTKSIPKIVGGANPVSKEIASSLYRAAFDQIVEVSTTQVAETSKLFENIFRSVNIALVNELKMICDPMQIDVWEVIRAASTKPFGFMPFWPGPGLGGHCIPIDPFYLSWKAKEYGLHTRFIELAGEINRNMPLYVVRKVQDCLNQFGKAIRGSKILILGLAYKPNIDDIRESPSLELMNILEEKGAHVAYHDPYCPEIGPTREYGSLAGRKSSPISDDYDCLILATGHKDFDPEELLATKVPIVDTRNLLPKYERVFPA